MINIYCINLDHRTDKWDFMAEQFLKMPNLNLIRVAGIKHENVTIGCGLSHIKCIEEYMKDNPFVIVMEDDCLIKNINTFPDDLHKIVEWLVKNKNNWTTFNGNPDKHRYLKTHMIENDLKLVRTQGNNANFIIYNNCPEVLELLLNEYKKELHEYKKDIYDWKSIAIDGLIYRKLPFCITKIPFLTTQTDKFTSDINIGEQSGCEKIRRANKRICHHFGMKHV